MSKELKKECDDFIATVFENKCREKKYIDKDEIWTIRLEEENIYIITPKGLKLGPPILNKYDEGETPSLIFNSDDLDIYFETKNESMTQNIIFGDLIGYDERFGLITVTSKSLKPLR